LRPFYEKTIRFNYLSRRGALLQQAKITKIETESERGCIFLNKTVKKMTVLKKKRPKLAKIFSKNIDFFPIM